MEQLELILKNLSEAFKLLKGLSEKAANDIEAARRVKLEHDQKLAVLEEREKVVKSKEYQIMGAERLSKAKDELEVDRIGFEDQKKRFEKHCAGVRSGFEQRESDLISKLDDVARREKELKKEKETYKQQLLEKLNK